MQELEKILEEIKESAIMVATSKEHYIHPQDGRFVEEVVLLDCVEDIIRKHMNNGWIPVEERLPKTNETYNVTRHIDGHFISDSAYFDGQNTWHSDNRVNHSRPYLTDVIAWRPLPEPYRPERSEK